MLLDQPQPWPSRPGSRVRQPDPAARSGSQIRISLARRSRTAVRRIHGTGRCLTAFRQPGILNLARCGSSSVVEHRLAKARVASSNLVSRSIPPSGARRVGYGGLERCACNEAALPRRGTQVVRERSAKPLCVGSIPTRASNPFNNLEPNLTTGESVTVAEFVATAPLCSRTAPENR